MNEIFRIKLILQMIMQNKRKTAAVILITSICLLVLTYGIIIRCAGKYNYTESDEIFTMGVKGTGTILIESEYDRDALDSIIADIRAADGVGNVGMSSEVTVISREWFGDYANDESIINASDETGEYVNTITINAQTAQICRMELEEGTLPSGLELDSDMEIYLYLGSSFDEIPLGTIFERELPDGSAYKVIVAGRLKKGQKWLGAVNYAFFNCSSLSDGILMDNSILACEKDVSGFPVFFNLEEGADFAAVKQNILAVGEKYGIKLDIASIEDKYIMADEQRKVMNAAISESMVILGITAAVFLAFINIIEFYQERRTYGLYLVTGMDMRDIGCLVAGKKFVEIVISTALTYMASYWLCSRAFGVVSSVDTVISDVLNRYALPEVLAISFIAYAVFTSVYICGIRKYTLFELLNKRGL